jgi:amino acid transporter
MARRVLGGARRSLMNPYRSQPTRLPRISQSTPVGLLVTIVVIAWLALSTGAPTGKDGLLWGFTGLLLVVVGVLWSRHATPSSARRSSRSDQARERLGLGEEPR